MLIVGSGGRLAILGAAAWAGYAWAPQCLLPWLAVRRGPSGRRQVALTFDDGPAAGATPRLLRLLEARAVRGTFFLIGERAVHRPDLVRAIVAAGHEVGTHTWRHRNAWFLGPTATRRELVEGARALADITGRMPTLYRPPWGVVNLAALLTAKRMGLQPVLWSLQPEGLQRRSVEQQLRHCRRRLHDGAIVDLHDAPGLPGAPERLLGLMPGLLELLADRGYAAVPVGTLLGGAPRLRALSGGARHS